jgi:hypothetical protein
MIFFSAVSFAVVPAMVTVVEGGTPLSVCVQMTTTPAEATLGKEVVVTLSTVDGTGMYGS